MTIKYLYIADHLELCGGAEISDSVLVSFLDCEVTKIRCADCTVQKLEALKTYRVIISNFVGLSPACKDYIVHNMNYVKWCHDHQYLKSRNPSIYKDFIAPTDQIINYEFYKNAKTVVCQTDKHTTVVKNNLKLNNIRNFSGNLWTKEQLSYLESISKDRNVTEDLYAILDSDIIHKGTQQSINWCKKNNKKYKLLPLQDWEDFIRELSTCSHLCFFPGVLETCSRMAVEARMLGLTITGNHLISALYEPWFKEKRGVELIDYFREKNKTIKQFIDDCFTQKWLTKEDNNEQVVGDITCVLNLYRRPELLQKQIDHLLAQSVRPKYIWVWHNYHEDSKDFDFSSIKGVDRWVTSNHNWKYFGRFSLGLMAETKFLSYFDCDTFPAKDWHQACLETYAKTPGVLGGIGVRLNSSQYANHYRIGWAEPRATIEEVDLVGHSWFLAKEHLRNMWTIEPFSLENAEDIHLSFANYLKGIKTYVVPQLDPDTTCSMYGYQLGVGLEASSHPSNHTVFYLQRDQVIEHCLNNGWKLLKDR